MSILEMIDDITNISLEQIQLENKHILMGEMKETERDRKKREYAASVERSELREVCRG